MTMELDKELHDLKKATSKNIHTEHNQLQDQEFDKTTPKESRKNNMEVVDIEIQPVHGKKSLELLENWHIVAGAALAMFLTVGFVASYGLLYVVLLEKFQGSAASTATIGALCSATGHLLGKSIT